MTTQLQLINIIIIISIILLRVDIFRVVKEKEYDYNLSLPRKA